MGSTGDVVSVERGWNRFSVAEDETGYSVWRKGGNSEGP